MISLFIVSLIEILSVIYIVPKTKENVEIIAKSDLFVKISDENPNIKRDSNIAYSSWIFGNILTVVFVNVAVLIYLSVF